MTRIGFSLAGEGRGHASRVIALSQVLQGRFDIVYFCPEPVRAFMAASLPGAQIESVPALNLEKKGHAINIPCTIAAVLRKARNLDRDVLEIRNRILSSGITVLISDFEPYASHAAALLGIPVLNLNHPGVILKFLSLSPGAWLAQLAAKLMMPPAQKTLICSFYLGDVGPIIRKELREIAPVRGDFYLVYVKDSSKDKVRQALKSFTDIDFRFFPDSRMDFAEALAGCRGVIAPAGHQLISEALVLGKPILVIPQAGQFEQRLNARMLRRSGCGNRSTMPTLKRDVGRFIRDIDTYHAARAKSPFFRVSDETERAAAMIEEFIRDAESKRLEKRIRYGWFSSLPGTAAQLGRFRNSVA